MSKNLMYGKSIDSSQWGKLDRLISCPDVTSHPLWWKKIGSTSLTLYKNESQVDYHMNASQVQFYIPTSPGLRTWGRRFAALQNESACTTEWDPTSKQCKAKNKQTNANERTKRWKHNNWNIIAKFRGHYIAHKICTLSRPDIQRF